MTRIARRYSRVFLLKYLLSKFLRLHSYFNALVFQIIAQARVVFHTQIIFGCLNALFDHPLGIHVQTARAMQQRSAVKLLPILAQEPVHENLCGIGMRRILENRQTAIAVAGRRSLAWFGKTFDRQASFDERFRLRDTDTSVSATFAFANASASCRR